VPRQTSEIFIGYSLFSSSGSKAGLIEIRRDSYFLLFVSSEKFIEAHSGKLGDISIYGQESNYTTWHLAKMNLAIRGIDAQIAHGDTFHNDRHPDLKAD